MTVTATIGRVARALPVVLLFVAVRPALAQPAAASACVPTDTDAVALDFARGVASARERLAADKGRLWGRRLEGAWIGFRTVGSRQCLYASAAPRVAGFARVSLRDGDVRRELWTGALPAGMNPANTDYAWDGRRWAGVLLPLPRDARARARLLVHEVMHTHQPKDTLRGFMPAPLTGEGGEGSDLLEQAAGRLWLRLEMRALERALRSSGAAQRSAARDALLFRAARYAAGVPRERERQRGLDVREGLAEYTAIMLTLPDGARRTMAADALAAADRDAADSTSRKTLVRSFPYVTGPAYALLLDAMVPQWRPGILGDSARADLQARLAGAVAATPEWSTMLRVADPSREVRERTVSEAETAAASYGQAEVRAYEDARWERVEGPRRALRSLFDADRTLHVRPGRLDIVFDPNGQTSLGTLGTVMRGFMWKAADGAELAAPEGALVTADWSEIRVPLDSATAAGLAQSDSSAAVRLRSVHGWTLTLPAGWRLSRDGASWTFAPPRR